MEILIDLVTIVNACHCFKGTLRLLANYNSPTTTSSLAVRMDE